MRGRARVEKAARGWVMEGLSGVGSERDIVEAVVGVGEL